MTPEPRPEIPRILKDDGSNYVGRTIALCNLKVALKKKFPLSYREGEKYNFRDSFDRLSAKLPAGRQGQLVFDQIMNEDSNDLSRMQKELFYSMFFTAVWDNASTISDAVPKDSKLWYHLWSEPNNVKQMDHVTWFARLYQNKGYEGGHYEYVGIGPETFPVMGSLLVQSDYVGAYAHQWFTSILMSMQNTSQSTSNL